MKQVLSKELKEEVASIFRKVGQYPEAKVMGTQLISKLKSEAEGRGTVPPEALGRLRRAFEVLTQEEQAEQGK